MARRNGNTGAAQAAPTLDELATRIREESKAGDEADLARAIRLGVMLRQAREQVPRGAWQAWLRTNFHGGVSTAHRCVRLADPDKLSRVRACQSVREAVAAIAEPKRSTDQPKRKREAGKRLRALHAKRRQGDDSTLMNMRVRVQQVVSVLEGVALDEYGVEGADDETITEVHEELSMLAVWLDKSLTVLDSHINQAVRVERIRRLREDTNGRSPAEIETARRLADRLERKHLVAV